MDTEYQKTTLNPVRKEPTCVSRREIKEKKHLTLNQKRAIACVITIANIPLLVLLIIYNGKPYDKLLYNPGQFKEWVQSHGISR